MSRLFLVEGPDGAGKTTLAKALAAATGAKYYHHGPYHSITGSGELTAEYVVSMMPVATRSSDVILDRCWISEKPYGAAFRCGADRLEPVDVVALEGFAKRRCAALVVLCLPPWEKVAENFGKKAEYLSGLGPLRVVYDWYAGERLTALPVLRFDPLAMTVDEAVRHVLDEMAMTEAAHD